MYCRYCRALIDDKAVVCTKCGCRPLNGTTYCQKCGATTTEEQKVCVQCGSKLGKKTSNMAIVMNHVNNSTNAKKRDRQVIIKQISSTKRIMKISKIATVILLVVAILTFVLMATREIPDYSDPNNYITMPYWRAQSYTLTSFQNQGVEMLISSVGELLFAGLSAIEYFSLKHSLKKLERELSDSEESSKEDSQ